MINKILISIYDWNAKDSKKTGNSRFMGCKQLYFLLYMYNLRNGTFPYVRLIQDTKCTKSK